MQLREQVENQEKVILFYCNTVLNSRNKTFTPFFNKNIQFTSYIYIYTSIVQFNIDLLGYLKQKCQKLAGSAHQIGRRPSRQVYINLNYKIAD